MKKKFDNQAIGQRIKNIRLEQKLTQEEFGKLFTPLAARPVVVNWEKGNYKPQKERLNKIAEMGNTTVEYLLTGVDPISGKTDRYYSEVPKKEIYIKEIGNLWKIVKLTKIID
ncbi:helix-turn-helix transcriptional regulator [Enterococcus cecorum]